MWVVPIYTAFIRIRRPNAVSTLPPIFFGIFRILANFVALIVASEVPGGLDEGAGSVFELVLDWVIRSAKLVGDSGRTLGRSSGGARALDPVFVVFEERGVLLDGSGDRCHPVHTSRRIGVDRLDLPASLAYLSTNSGNFLFRYAR